MRLDITGKRFGRLTAISYHSTTDDRRSVWICKCDCGKEGLFKLQKLRRGNTQSCGCLRSELNSQRCRKVIPPGTRYGFLTVVEPAPSRNQRGQFVVRCDCGKVTVKALYLLRTAGSSLSCGAGCTIRRSDASKNQVLANYRQGARTRGLVWNLEEDEFYSIVTKPCHYCGICCNQVKKSRFEGGVSFAYTGIDRIDSRDGYHPANCLPCCYDCNRAKMARSYDEFIEWVYKAFAHLKKNEGSRWISK